MFTNYSPTVAPFLTPEQKKARRSHPSYQGRGIPAAPGPMSFRVSAGTLTWETPDLEDVPLLVRRAMWKCPGVPVQVETLEDVGA